MDFGLAKPLGIAPGSTSGSSAAPPSFTAAATMSGASPLSPLTTAGTIVGTIQYMSPEQIEGKEADARSDIFSFGVVMYELLAGTRPSDPAAPLGADVPVPLRMVVEKSIEKDPAERYQSTRDLVVDLRRLTRQTGENSALPATLSVAASPEPAARFSKSAVLAALGKAPKSVKFAKGAKSLSFTDAIPEGGVVTYKLSVDVKKGKHTHRYTLGTVTKTVATASSVKVTISVSKSRRALANAHRKGTFVLATSFISGVSHSHAAVTRKVHAK